MFRYSRGGIDFVPLITFPMEAHCYLSIRMGRPTRPGSILFGRRDVDNRLKILVDALRMPHQDNEVPKDHLGDKEMFCLLADDNLVTRLSITSYRLLSGYTCDANIHIDIDVTIRPITAMIGTSDLLF
jgi:Holliday junction resolvase RusA-like endonuclease